VAAARETTPRPQPIVLDLRSPAEWERWLEQNHEAKQEGAWLRLFKKGHPDAGLSYPDAVLTALCFGWIDGQAKKHDDVSRIQRFTPRRRRSVWSKLNIERAERLIDEGRMQDAGLRAIEAAKQDGRWEKAYDPPSTATIPDDFLSELRKNKRAEAFFATLNKRNTYPVVHRLQTAKTAETRARRIQAMIDMFERGEKFHD
jgi:uncharacterized protein YdeI (YjbR/CyaY-like superfamily)